MAEPPGPPGPPGPPDSPDPVRATVPVVLASASPRRRELLARILAVFDVDPAETDESVLPGESPGDYVARLAQEKARSVSARRPGAVVIGADTTVELDGSSIGKPTDRAGARSILGRLSGRTHTVLTGVAVVGGHAGLSVRVVATQVAMAELTGAEIDWYVDTGEPMGKAGAYALQGRAAVFVERVEGDPTNVIGLPLRTTALMLSAAGVSSVAQ